MAGARGTARRQLVSRLVGRRNRRRGSRAWLGLLSRGAPAAVAVVLAIVAWPLVRLQGASVETLSIAAVSSLIGLVIAGTVFWRSARMLSTTRRLIAALAQDMEMQPLGTQSPGWRAPRPRSSDALVTPVQSCEGAD